MNDTSLTFCPIIRVKGDEEMIRHSLYSEYVLARQQIAIDGLTLFVELELDQYEGANYDLTPNNPLLRKFTQGEIELFEEIFRRDTAALFGDSR
jgi:hypothetical protein